MLLAQIEQQRQQIAALQSQLCEKCNPTGADEHVVYMQKRVEELGADARRYFDQYRTARDEHIKLLASLAEKGKEKRPRAAAVNLNAFQKQCQTEDREARAVYERRIAEIERTAQEFVGRKTEYERRIADLEKMVKTKEEQEEKIETYVSKLVQMHREAKDDVTAVLKLIRAGNAVPNELYDKYLQGTQC